ncbi:MAG: RagB/SusD family nutrient uptake outer membrane protein [Flavobacteriales bacterium]|nr:RagB/SusD family nutrient uptake outer membrane protein [Flavobacteriales bacterium]
MKNINNYIKISFALLLGLNLASCTKFDEMTNPNEMTVDTFWVSEESAIKGTNAVYTSLQRNGTYKKWFSFITDASSDEAMSTSPWSDLSNVSKFTYVDYNFVVNYESFQDHYRGIWRANQVLTMVPGIKMNEELKARLLGETRFIRALLYYNMVNLWGNVPLATESADRPNKLSGYPQQGIPAIWALIEEDLKYAKANLPKTYSDVNLGRATWGAATALLGKAYMQQHKWSEAETELGLVVNSGLYSLAPNFKDNFTHYTENNQESIFEVQVSDEFMNTGDQDGQATSSLAIYRSIFISPAGWSDVQGTIGMLNFFKDNNDPRLKDTYIYPNDDETYYGVKYGDLELGARAGSQWIRKHTREYYLTQAEEKTWDSPINFRVIRLADIKLLYAEALVHNGNPSLAETQITDIRDRVSAGPSPFIATEGLAKAIENERILELSGESIRMFDLRRLGYFEDQSKIDELKARDPEFNTFRTATKGYLPIPTKEIDTNAGIIQNEGW